MRIGSGLNRLVVMILDFLLLIYFCAAVAMSIWLTREFPEFNGWGNVSRAIAWPVTVYEINEELI